MSTAMMRWALMIGVVLWLPSCEPDDPTGGAGGAGGYDTGGSTGGGGSANVAGSTSSGGSMTTGGVPTTGGTATGGTVVATGGSPSMGGVSTGGRATGGMMMVMGGFPSTGGTTGTGGTGTTYTITIQNFAYSPSNLGVPPGATVTVVNQDSVAHSVTSESAMGNFTPGGVNGVSFNTGNFAAGTRTFAIPAGAPLGTVVPYYCVPHGSSMPQGTVSIQ